MVRFHRKLLLQPHDDACLSPHAAMTLAGKTYFDAVSKVGENAVASPVSRELGEFHVNGSRSYLWNVGQVCPGIHICVVLRSRCGEIAPIHTR